MEIQQQQGDPLPVEVRDGLPTIRRGQRVQASALQRGLEERSNVWVVVGDDNDLAVPGLIDGS
jgi:hypothetical protein